MTLNERHVGIVGLSSVLILIVALATFGSLNSDFSFTQDYISQLGAKGEPYALGFNLFGFVVVGVLLFAFGLSYGRLLHDRFLSYLLSLFGLGFAFTAIPIDMELSTAPISKAHIVAICLGLAFWLFGLSRLGSNQHLNQKIRNRANFTAIILVLSMMGFVFEFWSMPIIHRLVFITVFGWTTVTSVELIIKHNSQTKNYITPQ